MNAIVKDIAGSVIDVPFVVAGRLLTTCAVQHRSRDMGGTFRTPPLDLAAIARPRSVQPPAANIKLDEIIRFLVEVGRCLTPDNPHLVHARLMLTPVATLPAPVLERLYARLSEPFQQRALEIEVEADVGREALDGWKAIPVQHGSPSYVRAYPPRLVHVLAGNSPVVAARTIAEGALLKGVHLLKMPSNDLFTATAILRTMLDIDATHPVVRSFSAVYWKGGDDSVEDALYRPQFFDKIVVWGGENAVRHVQKYVGPGLQLVSWDPKTSISMIGREAFESEERLREVAARAAVDSTLLNQDACIASRYHYIEGDRAQADRYCELLIKELGVEREFCSARGFPTPDAIREEVEPLRMLDPEFRVLGRYDGSGLVVRSDEPLDMFPDFRTVNVVPVKSLEDAARFCNVATQTVGIYPAERKSMLRDLLAAYGVQYVNTLGKVIEVPPGVPHDATYSMGRLVRWVASMGEESEASGE